MCIFYQHNKCNSLHLLQLQTFQFYKIQQVPPYSVYYKRCFILHIKREIYNLSKLRCYHKVTTRHQKRPPWEEVAICLGCSVEIYGHGMNASCKSSTYQRKLTYISLLLNQHYIFPLYLLPFLPLWISLYVLQFHQYLHLYLLDPF